MKETWKRLRRDWGKKSWFLANMYFTAVYLLWRIFFTIPFSYGFVSIAAGLTLLVVEALGMVEAFVHYLNMYNVEDYPLPEVPPETFPEVDVFVCTCTESPELLRKTLLGCRNLEYPDKSKVHIYLCDDGHREVMAALAAEMGVNYLARENHEGAKAGNLNYALAHSRSPYVATFDADMIPQSRFLLETVPYFVDAELKNRGLPPEKQVRLGFVQTPQSFYDLDLFQFHLFSESRVPNEQDYFYRDIQVARTRTNSVIYGGSNTVLSRRALLDAGGFYTGAVTEDFATGILIEKKGYVSLGLGKPLASGRNAGSLNSLIRQRCRWARGVIATGRKLRIFTASELTFAQKMNYWASIWYWYAPVKRLSYILSPILYAAFGFMVFRCTLPQVLLFWLPMYVSSNISLRALSQNIRSTKWTAIYETALFPFLLLPVLLETLGMHLKTFHVTDKEQSAEGTGRNYLYLTPFLILIALSVLGIVRCVILMFDSGSFGPIVVLFWLVNNLFMLVMGLFFADGRLRKRGCERVTVSLPGKIALRDTEYDCVTKDLSETGAAIFLSQPHFLDPEAEIFLTLSTEKYRARVRLEPVFVTPAEDGRWQYSFRIVDFGDSRENWLGLLYDRVPTLPARIRKNSGFYEDLSLNIGKRAAAPFYEKRLAPRIPVNRTLPCQGGGTVQVHDFNYRFLTAAKDSPAAFALEIPDWGVLPCAYVRDVHGLALYAIDLGTPTQTDWDSLMAAVLAIAAPESKTPRKKEKAPDFNEIDALTDS